MATAGDFKVFIVDDDPSSRLSSSFCFTGPEYEVHQFDSGEACLAALEIQPDIVLLDIEMPGVDGVQTCKALRDAGLAAAQVIFVSVHNDLETRLGAYDAGGNDYIVKPVLPDELGPKIAVARQVLEQQRTLEARAAQASSIAFSAMSSAAELGIVLEFLRATYACDSMDAVHEVMAEALGHFSVQYIAQLRCGDTTACYSRQGESTELEKSILEHVSLMDRIFQFHDRMVINYPNVTLLVFGLPLDDETRLGRLRDNLAMLAEGADARLLSLRSHLILSRQAAGIDHVLKGLSQALVDIEKDQDVVRLNALCLMDGFIGELERAFVHLGLSESQEASLSELARSTAARVGGILSEGKSVTDDLHRVGQSLRQLHSGD